MIIIQAQQTVSRGRTKFTIAPDVVQSTIKTTTELNEKRNTKLINFNIDNDDIETGSSSRKSVIYSQNISNSSNPKKNLTSKTISTRKSRFKSSTITDLPSTTPINIVTTRSIKNTDNNFRKRSQVTTASPSFATTSSSKFQKNITMQRNTSRRPSKNVITTDIPTLTTTIIGRGRIRGAKKMSYTSMKTVGSNIEDENYPQHFKNLIKSKKIDNVVVVTAQTIDTILETTKSIKPTTHKSVIHSKTTSSAVKNEKNRTNARSTISTLQDNPQSISTTKNFYFPTRTTRLEASEEEHVWIDESPKYQKKTEHRLRNRLSSRPKSTRSTPIENYKKPPDVDTKVSMDIIL